MCQKTLQQRPVNRVCALLDVPIRVHPTGTEKELRDDLTGHPTTPDESFRRETCTVYDGSTTTTADDADATTTDATTATTATATSTTKSTATESTAASTTAASSSSATAAET